MTEPINRKSDDFRKAKVRKFETEKTVIEQTRTLKSFVKCTDVTPSLNGNLEIQTVNKTTVPIDETEDGQLMLYLNGNFDAKYTVVLDKTTGTIAESDLDQLELDLNGIADLNGNCDGYIASASTGLAEACVDMNPGKTFEEDYYDTDMFQSYQGEEVPANEFIADRNQEDLLSPLTIFVLEGPNNTYCNKSDAQSCQAEEDLSNLPDLDFKIVLGRFQKYSKLEESDRNALVHCVMKHTLQHNLNRCVNRVEFENISKAIVKLFPTEEEKFYYIPALGGAPAKGKLFSCYKNLRRNLADANLIQLRPKKVAAVAKTDVKNATDKLENGNDNEITVAMKFVEQHTECYEEIHRYWVISHQERMKLLNSGNYTSLSYIQRFPILETATGFEWFNIDFNMKYPKTNLQNWDDLSDKILKYASRQSNKHVKDLIDKGHRSSSGKSTTAFKVLPFLLRNPNVATATGKTSTRLKKQDIFESFIPTFNNELHDGHYFNNIKSYPNIIVIGSENNAVAHVRIAHVQYTFKCISEAVHACLKLFLLLNYEFPIEVKHVWDFIQHGFYQIDVKELPASTIRLLSEIKNEK